MDEDWTDSYMKVRPKDARLNPKGTLPDWEWTCKKPMILINKDFRHVLPEQLSDQCKQDEQQQWCHEDKSVSVGNLTLKVELSGGSLTLAWDILKSVGSDFIKAYQVTVQHRDEYAIENVQRMHANDTSFTFSNLDSGIPYTVCVVALGWGNSACISQQGHITRVSCESLGCVCAERPSCHVSHLVQI